MILLIDICEKQSYTFTGIMLYIYIVIHFYRTVFIYANTPILLLYSDNKKHFGGVIAF